jgi:hypothetical protein
MIRWLSLTLLVCASALGLVACGGGDSGAGGGGDPSAVLKETFGASKEVKSGQLTLGLKVNTKGLANVNGPIGLKLTGPFQSQGGKELPSFDFTAQIDLSGQSLQAGAVATPDKGYLKFAGSSYVLSDALYKQFKDGYAEQAECNEGKDTGVSFKALGIDPSRWLGDAKDAGSEEVGGAKTTHITATIDVPAFLEDVNRILGRTGGAQQADPCAADAAKSQADKQGGRTLTEAEREQIAKGITSASVDVWTGEKDRTLRRLNIKLAFDVPADQRSGLNGLSSGDVAFDLVIAKLNEDQTIKAPAGAKPLEELQQALGGAIPGLGAGSSGSGSSGSGSTGGASASGSKYDQCVADAGADVSKLQQCADLIGQ